MFARFVTRSDAQEMATVMEATISELVATRTRVEALETQLAAEKAARAESEARAENACAGIYL